MTILSRLNHWKEVGAISLEQHAYLSRRSRREPLSVFLELNALLYAGVLAFVAGLSWTVITWSQQLGAFLIVAILTILLGACIGYCATKAPVWSFTETPPPNLIFDYVLYLGSFVWGVELAYLENHFHLLSGKWDVYLLATAVFYFVLAYRFDNRFVLSLALSSLAGWFGLTISHWPSHQDETYRQYALAYCLLIAACGAILRHRGVKPHFFATYLNLAANIYFWAVLSGVFEQHEFGLWLVALLVGCGLSLAWGLRQRQFAFVAYSAVYGYVGLSSLLIRDISGDATILSYFVFTGVAMVLALVVIARRFGRAE